MFDIKSYHRAESVEDAIAMLSRNPGAIPIAGGTDVLVRLHQHNPEYRHLVDIHDLDGLKKIRMTPEGDILIGSGSTFTQIIDDELVNKHIPVLAQGAISVGGPQVRNQATVGGNICNGAPSADSAAPLLVLNATVILEGPGGERRIPLTRFYQGPGRVDRKPAEIMTALVVAAEDYRCWTGYYYKYAMRDAMDIATIGCGGAVKAESGKVADLRLAFTVAGPTPLRCLQTEEKVRGTNLDESLIEAVKKSVLQDLRPRDSWRAGKEFREHIIQTLSEKVLRNILESCQ